MADIEIKVKIDGVEYTQEQLKEMAKQGAKAADSMKEVQKETKKTGEEATIFSEIKDKFNDMTKGVRTVINSMKTLRGAIAATGIGALVIALAGLISYFKSSEEGSRKLAIATEALKILFGKFMEVLSKVGEAIMWVFENPKQAIKDFAELVKQNIINRFEGLLELIPKLGEAIGLLFEGEFSKAGKVAADAVGKVVLGVEDVTDKVGGMVEAGKEAFNTLVEETNKAVKAATRLVDAQRALRNQQQKLIIDNANLNKEMEVQQRIAEDTTLAYDERKAALERVGKAQVALARNVAAQAANQEALLKLQIQSAATYEEREELETQLAEATAARIEAQTQLAIKEQEVGKITRELDLEELERKKSIQATLDDLRKSNITAELEAAREELRIAEEATLQELTTLRATEEEKAAARAYYAGLRENLEKTTQDKINEILAAANLESIDDQFQKAQEELRIAEEKQLAELTALEATEEEKQKIQDVYAKKRKKLAKDEADFKKNLEKQVSEANLQVASDALSALSGLVGENTAAGKAAAIAATTIDTYLAAQKAYTSQLLPGDPTSPIRAAIAAGVAVAAGIANVRKIIATPTPTAEGGGGGGGGTTPSAPSIPTFQGNTGSLNLGFNNGPNAGQSGAIQDVQNGTTQSGMSNVPIKTYVVATDMTTAQEANKKVEDLAKL